MTRISSREKGKRQGSFFRRQKPLIFDNTMRSLLFLLFFALASFSLPAQETPTAVIRGKVTERDMNAALPGAVVRLKGAVNLAAVTDSSGSFRFNRIPVGRYDLEVTMTGFRPAVLSNILANAGKEVVLEIGLEEDIVRLKEVEITGAQGDRPHNELATVSTQALKPEEINRFAGSRQDPSRMASGYAGVVSGGNTRNDIIVRGNSPSGVLWRLEGTDIPNPNHFSVSGGSGGAFAMLNNNLLAGADFMTGAFPAEYGNRTAAVFDLRLRNGNNEKYEHTFQLGMNGLEFGTEGPIGRNGASYLVNGRILDFSVIGKLGVELGYDAVPRYGDGSFKLNFPSKKAGTFSVWALGGSGSVDVLESKRDTADWGSRLYQEDNYFRNAMLTTGFSHGYAFNEKTFGKLLLNWSDYHSSNLNQRVFRDLSSHESDHIRNRESAAQASYVLTHKFNPRHLLKSGITGKQLFFDYDIGGYDFGSQQEVSYMDARAQPKLLQAYTHWQWKIGPELTMNTGLFAQRFSFNEACSIEPRWALQYAKNAHSICLGYGMHSQYADLLYALWKSYDPASGERILTSRGMGFLRAHHAVLGYSVRATDQLQVKAELYFQYLYDIPVSSDSGAYYFSLLNTGGDYSFGIPGYLVNSGAGRNYGIELTANRHFAGGWYAMGTVSLFDSRYRDYSGTWRNTAFNSQYVFNLLGGKEWRLDSTGRKVVSFDLRGNYAGGRRYIREIWRNGERQTETEAAFEHKWKDYFRADVKLGITFNRPKANHHVFAAVDNFTNYRNIFFMQWNDEQKREEPVYQIGLFPYLGYRVQF